MKCPNCGNTNREGAEFCRDCGVLLRPEAADSERSAVREKPPTDDELLRSISLYSQRQVDKAEAEIPQDDALKAGESWSRWFPVSFLVLGPAIAWALVREFSGGFWLLAIGLGVVFPYGVAQITIEPGLSKKRLEWRRRVALRLRELNQQKGGNN